MRRLMFWGLAVSVVVAGAISYYASPREIQPGSRCDLMGSNVPMKSFPTLRNRHPATVCPHLCRITLCPVYGTLGSRAVSQARSASRARSPYVLQSANWFRAGQVRWMEKVGRLCTICTWNISL